MNRPPLTRSRDERLLAGVCAGLAAHLELPVGLVRAVMAATSVVGGFGVLLYLWLWATVPLADGPLVQPMRRALTRPAAGTGAVAAASAPDAAAASSLATASPEPAVADRAAVGGVDGSAAGVANARPSGAASAAAPGTVDTETQGARGARSGTSHAEPHEPHAARRWPIAELLLGTGLLIAGLGLVLDRLGVSVRLEIVLPALAVLTGVGLTWWQIADRGRPERNPVPRTLGALALVAVGVLMFFVTSREPSAWTVIAAAIAVLTGVALALAPWVLRINRELMAERAARAREAERSDIAAHLHDSVLQTLALIQQRSDPGSEVARIARGQERELREWLFRGADGAGAHPDEAKPVSAALREHANALELNHAAQFELVVVGGEPEAPEAIVAAAREAMLNAAKHAGGSVTVYLESTPTKVSIDVTDRGPGFDPTDLPEGRMGVRESIRGRVERAGGTVAIKPGPGGTGTTVRISFERSQSAHATNPGPTTNHSATQETTP